MGNNFFERNKGKVFAVVGVVVFILCVFAVSMSVKTQAKRLENAVETAASDITVVEKERTDKLDLMFGAVKASSNHEKEVTNLVTSARANLSESNLGGAQKEIEKATQIIVENYPEITATDAYMEFMTASATSESKISSHRTNYNASVRNYNDFIDGAFNSMFLGISGYQKKELELLDFGKNYEDPKEYNWEE